MCSFSQILHVLDDDLTTTIWQWQLKKTIKLKFTKTKPSCYQPLSELNVSLKKGHPTCCMLLYCYMYLYKKQVKDINDNKSIMIWMINEKRTSQWCSAQSGIRMILDNYCWIWSNNELLKWLSVACGWLCPHNSKSLWVSICLTHQAASRSFTLFSMSLRRSQPTHWLACARHRVRPRNYSSFTVFTQ